ncbi:chaperone modulator CbpM [Hansschlegelia zhihuaiae]|uniref:Chaperone modulatory protein CbpM n=1 Tax=Hansschlegelia zhihuaiae TaxID=405005 RepID=A0A4Q0M9X8_9HYPH|nr:chaperone modulator CbpM [Hansschlegelia zhihuaiae]RXF69895.1 hypothetical protein EK403_18125 [Hansschlegelia zhihuaiae]
MIGIDDLVTRFPALRQADVERWMAHSWVRPHVTAAGSLAFHEIDVARIQLILELRDDMEIGEDALPVVLSLLDQLFDARRRMRELDDALQRVAPAEVRRALADHLARIASGRS